MYYVYLYMKKLFVFFFILYNILLSLGVLQAQCPTNFPSQKECNNCDYYIVNNMANLIMLDNLTYCIPANYFIIINNINFGKDSKLIICGNLTVNSNLNVIHGAYVWVSSTGTLTIVNGNISINSFSIFYNYGNVHASNLYLNGSNSAFYNLGYSANLNISNNIIVNASSQFVAHQSNVQAQGFTLNGNGQACLSDYACISVSNFTINGNGAIATSGNNPVVLYYTNSATLNSTVTNSNLVYVCQAPGATINGSGSWGAANVQQNCVSGCNILYLQKENNIENDYKIAVHNRPIWSPNPLNLSLNNTIRYDWDIETPIAISIVDNVEHSILYQICFDKSGEIIIPNLPSGTYYIIFYDKYGNFSASKIIIY